MRAKGRVLDPAPLPLFLLPAPPSASCETARRPVPGVGEGGGAGTLDRDSTCHYERDLKPWKAVCKRCSHAAICVHLCCDWKVWQRGRKRQSGPSSVPGRLDVEWKASSPFSSDWSCDKWENSCASAALLLDSDYKKNELWSILLLEFSPVDVMTGSCRRLTCSVFFSVDYCMAVMYYGGKTLDMQWLAMMVETLYFCTTGYSVHGGARVPCSYRTNIVPYLSSLLHAHIAFLFVLLIYPLYLYLFSLDLST